MFAVYFLLLGLPLVSGQATGHGHCPVPGVQHEFDLHRYSGIWFELARIPNTINQGMCVTAEHKLEPGYPFITAEHTELFNGQFITQTGRIRAHAQKGPAKLEIAFSENQPFRPYWVLYTDYDTYAVVYTCENDQDTHSQYVWVLGRSPYLDLKALEGIKHALLNQGIFGNKLMVTNQICYQRTMGKFHQK